jgi:hypothetical protein
MPEERSKAEEIYTQLKRANSLRAKYLDHDRLDLKRDFREIIAHGSEYQFIRALSAIGSGPETEEGKHLISMFRKIRGLD